MYAKNTQETTIMMRACRAQLGLWSRELACLLHSRQICADSEVYIIAVSSNNHKCATYCCDQNNSRCATKFHLPSVWATFDDVTNCSKFSRSCTATLGLLPPTDLRFPPPQHMAASLVPYIAVLRRPTSLHLRFTQLLRQSFVLDS